MEENPNTRLTVVEGCSFNFNKVPTLKYWEWINWACILWVCIHNMGHWKIYGSCRECHYVNPNMSRFHYTSNEIEHHLHKLGMLGITLVSPSDPHMTHLARTEPKSQVEHVCIWRTCPKYGNAYDEDWLSERECKRKHKDKHEGMTLHHWNATISGLYRLDELQGVVNHS